MSQDWRDSTLTLVEDNADGDDGDDAILFPRHDEWFAEEEELWEPHGDHQDHIEDSNVWNEEEFFWPLAWLYTEDQRQGFYTNKQLYESPYVAQRTKELAAMRKGGYLPLDAHLRRSFFIPLFTNDQGEEYQLECGHGYGREPQIPLVLCPSAVKPGQSSAWFLFELRTRSPITEDRLAMPLPRHIVSIGHLLVKTSARHVPAVEHTDYSVVVDVDHEDLPVWILAPKQQLADRIEGMAKKPGWPTPNEALPIFNGLMNREDGSSKGYHDVACILNSARRLGLPPSDANAPSFRDACDLVKISRASVDPLAVRQPKEKLLEYVAEEFIPPFSAQMELDLPLDAAEEPR